MHVHHIATRACKITILKLHFSQLDHHGKWLSTSKLAQHKTHNTAIGHSVRRRIPYVFRVDMKYAAMDDYIYGKHTIYEEASVTIPLLKAN